MYVNIHLHSNHSECTLPKELFSWQAKLKSWKECGRKLSHYGIMCTEIQRNHVYYSHVGPMKCADIPTHVTYFIHAKDARIIQGISIISFSKFDDCPLLLRYFLSVLLGTM
jgi:hypothetical protein